MKKLTIAALSIALAVTSYSASAHEDGTHNWTGKSTPTVKVIATADMMAGFNIQVKTKNFKWAPQHASQAHKAGEGHAHIYVDDVKIGRIYGEWYHLSIASLNLTPGAHTVKVNLNGNDHMPYLVKMKPLEAVATIIIK